MQPPLKNSPPLSQLCPSKNWGPVKSPFLKYVRRFNPIHPLTPYDWISKSAILEDFFENLFVDMSKEKILKIELLTRGQSNNELWYNYRKGVITTSKAQKLIVLTKMNKILKPTSGYVVIISEYIIAFFY